MLNIKMPSIYVRDRLFCLKEIAELL